MKGIIKQKIKMRNGCFNPSKQIGPLPPTAMELSKKKKKKKSQVTAFVKDTYFM